MFSLVSVCFSIHVSSFKNGLQLKVLGRGHAAAAAEVQSQRLLPPRWAMDGHGMEGRNMEKVEKRKKLCRRLVESEKLMLVIQVVILFIYRSSDLKLIKLSFKNVQC